MLFQQHFAMMSSDGLLDGYDVVVCERCGFCFADNIPPQSAFDTYYREMSKYEHQDRMGDVSPFDWARLQLIASYLKKYLRNPGARIMEIGCSTGTLLSMFKESGYQNVRGVDPSPVCAEVADRLYGIQVVSNTLSDLAIEGQSIDVLILAGVLEHVRDVNTALLKCITILADGGLVYLAVPDASRYAEGEDAPFQEFSVEHINFFGPQSLTNLMNVSGFARIDMEQGMIMSNRRTTTPVLHVVFTKRGSNCPSSYIRDTETESGLARYLGQSRQTDDRIRAAIAAIVDAGQPIIVWGTGAHTLRLLASTRLGEANIRAFVDSNPRYHGRQLNNVPILPPEALANMNEPILICSRGYQEEIAAQIRGDLHLQNELRMLY
jgi:SAM-dependent methyltransferase